MADYTVSATVALNERLYNNRLPSISTAIVQPMASYRQKKLLTGAINRYPYNFNMFNNPNVHCIGYSSSKQNKVLPKDFPIQEQRLRVLESQVQSLKLQLQETKTLLADTKSENEKLRNLFTSTDPEELEKLRKCLSVAEQDVIKRQEEMDYLRRQYESESITSNQMSNVYSLEISKRLVSLLKVQVGALSKVIHSSESSKFVPLRQTIDKLIRTVAILDENKEQSINEMELAFIDVVSAYEKLSNLIDYRSHKFTETSTMTDPTTSSEDLIKDIQDLENELEEIQITHKDEIESTNIEFERQLKILRERMEIEENSKKKLQDELQTIHNTNEQRIATVRQSYEETINELKLQYEKDLQKLYDEHIENLEDEKHATRLALDAVRRSYEEELQMLTEKLKKEQEYEQCNTINTNKETNDRQNKIIEQITAELTNLSAMYSAKCLENSQLDEKIQSLLINKENQTELEEIDSQNRRLQRELRQKEATIDELKLKILFLEKKLNSDSTEAINKVNDDLDHVPQEPQVPVQFQSKEPQQKCEQSVQSTASVRFRQQGPTTGLSKVASSRRHDLRYHSNPIIPVMTEIVNQDKMFMDEMRKTLAVPVSERRKFFERVAEYNL